MFLCQRQIFIEGSFSRIFPQPCAAKNLIRLFLKDITTSVFSSPLAGMHLHLTHPKCRQLERTGLSLELHLRPEDIWKFSFCH